MVHQFMVQICGPTGSEWWFISLILVVDGGRQQCMVSSGWQWLTIVVIDGEWCMLVLIEGQWQGFYNSGFCDQVTMGTVVHGGEVNLPLCFSPKNR